MKAIARLRSGLHRPQAWIAALVAALLAGDAAFAQTAEPPLAFRDAPSPTDMGRAYPRSAWAAQQEGRVVLCCLVTSDDRLACAAIAEAPRGMGFDEAARTLSSQFRLTPESAAAWRLNGGVVRLPIMFRAERNPAAAPPIPDAPQCGRPAEVR